MGLGHTNNINQITEILNMGISFNEVIISLGKTHVILFDIINILDNTNNIIDISYVLYGCGNNEYKQIDMSSNIYYSQFKQMDISNLNGIKQIYASDNFNILLDNSGYLYGNGKNNNIIDVDSSNVYFDTFVKFNRKRISKKPIMDVNYILMGYNTTFYTNVNKELYVFGKNDNGNKSMM